MEAYEMEEFETIQTTNEEVIALSDNQKKIILTRWNDDNKTPPSITELLEKVFPNDKIDGRSKEAMLIKEYLVENGLELKTNNNKLDKKYFELKDEHKEYILNNYTTSKPIEMARVLFGKNVYSASVEMRGVISFIKTLEVKGIPILNEDEEYNVPRTLDRVVSRVRKYVDEEKGLDAKKLTPNQKKNMESLISYLSSFRFGYQIDTYEDTKDKELFESSFIKYTYDKNDLTQENCDQYVLLCSLIIRGAHIQRKMNQLQDEQDRVINEEGKISMAVVEAIKTAGIESDSCMKMQQALYKSLTQERSDKLNEEIKDKASLLNLINAWKNYETRQNLLRLAGEKKDKLRKDLHELENLDEMKMRILGLSLDEVVDG